MPANISRRGVLRGVGVVAAGSALGLSLNTAPAAAQNTFYEKFPIPVSSAKEWQPNAESILRDGYVGVMQPGPDGVPLYPLNGQLVIHATVLGNYLNSLLDSVQSSRTPQPLNLKQTVTTMNALMKRATYRRGAAFIKYEFDWKGTHGPLPSPWYSSFGQSKFPRVAHRLYTLTGERKWLQACDQLVRAFLEGPLPESPNSAFVAGVDSSHHLWLDEYPSSHGLSTVFNGHFYALNSLWHYGMLSRDPRARDLVQGATATMAHYRNLCRNPGRFSHYFASTTANVPSYHHINTSCYHLMYNLTGWEPFAKTVDALIGDWRYTDGAAMVNLTKGAALKVRPVNGTARVNAGTELLWTPTSAVRVNSTMRSQFVAFPGVWSRMEDGPMKNHWVLETPQSFREGFDTDRAEYDFRRSVYFEPGRVTSYRADATGRLTVGRTATFSTRAVAHSTLRAKVSGQQCARIDDGTFAGQWVKLNSLVHF